MINDLTIYGIVQEVQSTEPLVINRNKYISVLVNASPINKVDRINLLRLLISIELFNQYYSTINIGDKVVVKGFIKNRYFGNNSKAKKVETNIIVREIIKADHYPRNNWKGDL